MSKKTQSVIAADALVTRQGIAREVVAMFRGTASHVELTQVQAAFAQALARMEAL